MPKIRLTTTFVVNVSDEVALRDAAFGQARSLEDNIGDGDYSATDAMAIDSRSALITLVANAVIALPGVSGIDPPSEGDVFGAEMLA